MSMKMSKLPIKVKMFASGEQTVWVIVERCRLFSIRPHQEAILVHRAEDIDSRSKIYEKLSETMKTFNIFVFTLAAVYLTEARKLPPYLVPCSKADPAKLNKCAKEHGISAIPNLLKGDKDFKLPSLSPLRLERIDINPGPSLQIKLSDITLKGLEKAVINNIVIDLPKQHVEVYLFFDRVEIESKYEIDGKFSLLPIKGKGPAHLSFDGLDIAYKVDFDFETKKDGKKYINEKIRPTVNFKIKKAHFQFDNLFDGDKALGDHTNKFLNENYNDVVKDIGSSVSETISAVCTNILRRYISVIPFEDIFLP